MDAVSKRFGTVDAVRQASLSIPMETFTAILGPSGCGKTTLLNLIAGLEQHDAGTLRLAGRTVVASEPPEVRGLGFVFQQPSLFPHLTVFENIAFPLRVRGESGAGLTRKVEWAMELTAITELRTRRPQQISGGQQQRASVARALVFQPAILLLDEPLSGLDRPLRESMQSELRRLQRRTCTTFVLVTHDREEAMALADTLVVMQDGRICQAGSPAELYRRPASRFAAEFLAGVSVITGRVAFDGSVVIDAGGVPRVIHRPGPEAPSYEIGDSVDVGLWPEDLSLVAEPAPEPDVVPARVEDLRFAGAAMIVTLSTAFGQMVAKVHAEEGARLRAGAEIGIRVDPLLTTPFAR